MTFALLVVMLAIAGGAMTAVAGAGTGSVLVPLFAQHFSFKVAVAAVAVPHLTASALRAIRLRREIDRKLLLRFGTVCAVTSLLGALLHTRVSSPVITYAFAALLVVAGVFGLTGWSERIRLDPRLSFLAGGLSGFFGGFAGEQGGIRAVALLGFELKKESFVATGTAVAVSIDLVRVPVYLVVEHEAIAATAAFIALAVGGVALGVLLGERLFRRIPQRTFSRAVSVIILVIGVLLFLQRPG